MKLCMSIVNLQVNQTYVRKICILGNERWGILYMPWNIVLTRFHIVHICCLFPSVQSSKTKWETMKFDSKKPNIIVTGKVVVYAYKACNILLASFTIK